ncbi:MAG TPA: hypothetical protein VJS67_13655 [Pseudonocardiaceae bacterium]|nr:hypothetical protein [Pseudonocardiaceae bacterium]
MIDAVLSFRPTPEQLSYTFGGLVRTTSSTYLSAADPAIFGNRETILEDASTGRTYTRATIAS